MILTAVILLISDVGRSAIVCTALSHNAIRVTWFYEATAENQYTNYIISWYNVDELNDLVLEFQREYRSYVDYLYEDELLSYNYQFSYEEILEDVAVSIGLSSLDYEIVNDTNYFEINRGLLSNHTINIAVRRISRGQNLRPGLLPGNGASFNCSVTLPQNEGTTTLTTTLSFYQSSPKTIIENEDPWMWIAIVPGILLTLLVAAMVAYMIYGRIRKSRSRSKVGLIANSWEADSNDDGRHWVVRHDSPTLSSIGGISNEYTRSSLHSGGTVTWDQLCVRHPLTTVEEEPDVDDDVSTFPHLHPIMSSSKYCTRRRISTPQVQKHNFEPFWPLQGRLSPPSTSESMSLNWTDDEQELDIHEPSSWKTFSRDRKYRRVAPMNEKDKKERLLKFFEETTNLLHEGTKQFTVDNVFPLYSTQPRRRSQSSLKKRLHPTYSSMNILSK